MVHRAQAGASPPRRVTRRNYTDGPPLSPAMGQQAKVEASYASTHMTRRNYKGGPPLSRVNGVKLDKNSRKEENPNPKPKVKPEPGTDDEPEGSTDEDEVAANEISDDDMCDYRGDKGRTRPSGTTLQEKIEAGDAAERERVKMPLRSSQRDYGKSNGQTKSRKRAHDSIDVSSDEELFPSVSQSSKRHKARTYGSKPALNPPKSSMSESVEPMSIANSQDNTKAEEDPTEEKEEGFKFPMEIDLGSPPPRTKSRSKIKSEHDVKLNGSCKSKPRAFPNDTISSSSLAASSNNQWLIETDDSELSTPLSSCPSSFELELSRVDEGLNSAEKSKSELAQSLCPVCNEEVDPELLEAFLEKPRRRVRDQLQFCDSHQRTTAKKQWQAEGFPIIDWDNFEQRIQGHFDDLEKLLVPDSPSFYHNVLVDALKSGKARNFRLTLAGDGLETISCGYYGTRGSTKMLQALTLRFSNKIRRLTASDQVINKAGVVGWTQSVLVPELAMRLVKEDMNVSDDIARQIMRDSINIGELLNANPNDVVPVPRKEETT